MQAIDFRYILGGIIIGFLQFYISALLLDKKISYKSIKFWIVYIIMILYLVISYNLTDSFIRVILSYLLLGLMNIFLWKESIVRTVFTSFLALFLTIVAETFYMILVVGIFNIDLDNIKNEILCATITNISIGLILYLLLQIKPLVYWLRNIVKSVGSNEKKEVILFSSLSLVILSMLLYYVYFELDLISAFFLSTIFTVTFATLLLFLLKEKEENIELQLEYEGLLKNLEEYERMYHYQRLANHEYKNELSIIRGLAMNNQKVMDYINDLIDIKEKDNEMWMEKLKLIPEGGLRGLLYYKMLIMEEKKILVDFQLGRDVTTNVINNVDYELRPKVCKLLGIYIDNAIETVMPLQDKCIQISIRKKRINKFSYLIISVMNNYAGDIDISKIEDLGYSTKGMGRGLGLSIAQEILKEEKKLTHTTKLIRHNFIQELKIKI